MARLALGCAVSIGIALSEAGHALFEHGCMGCTFVRIESLPCTLRAMRERSTVQHLEHLTRLRISHGHFVRLKRQAL